MRPVCTTEPSPIFEPKALIEPAPMPIPAFLLIYLTIEVAVALERRKRTVELVF